MSAFFNITDIIHLDLHSFPTRRSSDLHTTTKQAATLAKDAKVECLILTHISSRYQKDAEQILLKEAQAIFPQTRLRSEEHTSELQSRGHLVCRLLLEKKNNKLKLTT